MSVGMAMESQRLLLLLSPYLVKFLNESLLDASQECSDFLLAEFKAHVQVEKTKLMKGFPEPKGVDGKAKPGAGEGVVYEGKLDNEENGTDEGTLTDGVWERAEAEGMACWQLVEPLNREHLLKQPKRKEPTLISNAPFTTSKDEGEATDNSTAHSQGIRVETTESTSASSLASWLKAFSESSIEGNGKPSDWLPLAKDCIRMALRTCLLSRRQHKEYNTSSISGATRCSHESFESIWFHHDEQLLKSLQAAAKNEKKSGGFSLSIGRSKAPVMPPPPPPPPLPKDSTSSNNDTISKFRKSGQIDGRNDIINQGSEVGFGLRRGGVGGTLLRFQALAPPNGSSSVSSIDNAKEEASAVGVKEIQKERETDLSKSKSAIDRGDDDSCNDDGSDDEEVLLLRPQEPTRKKDEEEEPQKMGPRHQERDGDKAKGTDLSTSLTPLTSEPEKERGVLRGVLLPKSNHRRNEVERRSQMQQPLAKQRHHSSAHHPLSHSMTHNQRYGPLNGQQPQYQQVERQGRGGFKQSSSVLRSSLSRNNNAADGLPPLIVLDAPNIAMRHGMNKHFSSRGTRSL